MTNQTVKPPRWAVAAAHLAALTALPSCVWRLALAAGLDLGYHPAWIEANASSVGDRVYLVGLSLLTEGLALLTLGLVRPWGERLPAWVPVLGGRRVPRMAAVVPAWIGAVCLIGVWAQSVDVHGHWGCPVLTDIRDQELVLRKDVHHGVHGQEEAAASSFVHT